MSHRQARALVVAPHPDDETLGLGGTIARLAADGVAVTVLTVAAHMPPIYSKEAHETTKREAVAAHAVLGVADSRFLDKPALLLDKYTVPELNGPMYDVVDDLRPQLMFVPFPDRHIDHRRVFEAAMVVARPVGAGAAVKVLAAYETLSQTHWNAPCAEPTFVPNWTVDITDTLEKKVKAMECFASQVHPFPGPRSLESLKALALFRGSVAGFGYGEALQIIRMTNPPASLLSHGSMP